MTDNSKATTPSEDNFTPTQELFLETLAARIRLGENVWTYGNRHKSTARQLEEKGVIGWKSASVEGCIIAWFTPEGKKDNLSYPYKIPLLENYIKKEDHYAVELENYNLKSQLDILINERNKNLTSNNEVIDSNDLPKVKVKSKDSKKKKSKKASKKKNKK